MAGSASINSTSFSRPPERMRPRRVALTPRYQDALRPLTAERAYRPPSCVTAQMVTDLRGVPSGLTGAILSSSAASRWSSSGFVHPAIGLRLLAPGRGGVLGLGDMWSPGCVVPFVVDIEHRDVGHETVRGGAVPMLLARLEEHAVTGPDHLDRAAAALREADAFGDEDRLPVGVGVPRGARGRCEMDAARTQARRTRRSGDSVDEHIAREPVTWPCDGGDSVSCHLHLDSPGAQAIRLASSRRVLARRSCRSR